MLQKFYAWLLLLGGSAFVLAACSGAAADETPTAVLPDTATLSPAGGESSAPGIRTFVIIPEASEASYVVQEEFFDGAVATLGQILGRTETTGKTNQIEGEFQLDLAQADPLLGGHFIVNIYSLTSDERRRDQRIREQWLESGAFPLAQFTATATQDFPTSYNEGQEVSFKLLGDMTIREVTQPVTFDVTAALSGDTITGYATTRLRMTDFAFQPPSMGGFFVVEDEFVVSLTFTARES